MKMLWHQNVPDDFEMEFASQFVQSPHKPALEPFGVEDASSAIRAAGQIMEMIEAVIMLLPGHFAIIGFLCRIHRRKRDVCATRQFRQNPDRIRK